MAFSTAASTSLTGNICSNEAESLPGMPHHTDAQQLTTCGKLLFKSYFDSVTMECCRLWELSEKGQLSFTCITVDEAEFFWDNN